MARKKKAPAEESIVIEESKRPKIKVHMPSLIPTVLLSEHPDNSNKQSKHVFTELKASILEHGFDEPILVVDRTDGEPGYWVVSGNHRFKAGKDLGMDEIPAIVRPDWDDVEAAIQLVRRNYVRGDIDRAAFTEAVNKLSREADLALDIIMERMGFEDAEAFSDFYKEEKKRERRIMDAAAKEAIPQIKMLDDLGTILSMLFEKYGQTVPNGFIVFPAGGRNHIFIQVTPALKRAIDAVAQKCVADGMDINVALGGLLQIGIHHTKFTTERNHPEVQAEGSVTGSDELELIVEKDN